MSRFTSRNEADFFIREPRFYLNLVVILVVVARSLARHDLLGCLLRPVELFDSRNIPSMVID